MSDAILTQGPRDWGFLFSEANGSRSREDGTLVAGHGVVVAGTVLEKIPSGGDAGKLRPFTDLDADSNGLPDVEVAGILGATTDTTDGDAAAAYVARDAEVNLNLLVYPAESTAGGEKAATIAGLLALGIVARGEL